MCDIREQQELAMCAKLADMKVTETSAQGGSLVTKEGRTVSFQSTAAPISSAASVGSAPAVEIEKRVLCSWQDAEWHVDIPCRGPELEANPQWARWVEQVVECSMVAFNSDCLTMISRKSKFKLAILSAPTGEFLGFCVYKVNRGGGNLTIGKIAVGIEHRGVGYGKRMIKEVMKMGKKDKMIYFISLSSLPQAVKFYKRMNFKEFKDVKFTGVDLEEGEEFEEGQVYMEFKVRNAPKKGKK